jgi:regulatory protein YycH of two-component signal transduction system YycFG
MFERLKTIALTILVLLSLLQTYVLVYRTPQFEQAVQSDYVQTEQADILLNVEQLLKPRMIVAHLGEQVHSVFYPQTPVYGNMLETWRQFTYKNLQKTDMTLEQFYDQREQRLALSLQFEQDLELGTIQTLFNVTVDQEFQSQPLFDMLFAFWHLRSAALLPCRCGCLPRAGHLLRMLWVAVR